MNAERNKNIMVDREDSNSDNNQEDEVPTAELFDKLLWHNIKTNNPSITSVFIDWDTEDEEDEFIFDIDWKNEGQYFASNTHLKQVVISGIRSRHNINNFANLYHLLKGLAQNRSIDTLDIYDSDIMDDKWLPYLWPLFKHNHNLHTLQIRDCFISNTWEDDIFPETMKICNKTSLKKLIITDNDYGHNYSMKQTIDTLNEHSIEVLNVANNDVVFGEDVCIALGSLLRSPTCKLREISLIDINVSDDHLLAIADGMIGNKSLKKIFLCENECYKWKAFFSRLGKAEGLDLDVLDLSQNNINDEGVTALSEVVKCTKPKELDLSDNEEITPTCWKKFALGLQSSKDMLKDINLAGNNIDNAGLIELGRVVKNNVTLKTLDLGSNEKISALGWRSFMTDLCCPNSALEDLTLYSNDIDNDGLDILARWAANNSRLKSLQLSSNHQITSYGWYSFFVTLRNHNSVLDTLVLNDNNISNEGIVTLMESLGENLKSLDLSSNVLFMDIEAFRALSNLLRSPNCSLVKLNLCWNIIGDDEVILFANALADNNSLHELRLASSDPLDHVTKVGWTALANILCDRTSIDAAYTSNHTLYDVSNEIDDNDDDDEDANLNAPPSDDLNKLLRINQRNRGKSKSVVAREKIIKFHMLKDVGIDVNAFVCMELNELPSAISWIGRDTIGFSVLYQLCKSLPCLFESNLKVVGVKRKREGGS